MANEIVTEIRLELDKLRSDLKDAEKMGHTTGENLGKGVGGGLEDGLGKAFGGMKAAFAAAAAALAGAFTLKEAIHAASEQENAIHSLNTALAMTGNYSDAASQHFQNLASALQKTTVYADEVIIQGGAMLATLGKLSGEGLDRATKASLDMASALGMDATSAFNLVAKAATGHAAALGRYGITVKQTGDDTRDFNTALTELEKKFKGFADQQATTFTGAMVKTKNQFGEILESLGNIIIKSPAVIAALNGLSVVFAHVAESIAKWASGRDIIKELATVVITFGSYIVTYVIKPLEFLFNLMSTVGVGLAMLFSGLVNVIMILSSAITDYLIKPVIDFSANVLGKLVSLVDQDLGASIAAFVTQSTAAVSAGLTQMSTDSQAVTADLAAKMSASSGKLLDFNVADQANNYLTKAQALVDQVGGPVQEIIKNGIKPPAPTFFDNFAEGYRNATKGMIEATKQLGAQVSTTFNTGFSNAFAAMGAALVKGESMLAAFGKSILGAFGDIAIQLGSFFIAQGIAMLFTIGGAAAGVGLIAAGGGLAIVGGALKALGGGGGSAAPSPAGASGGGVAAGGGGGGMTATPNAATAMNEQAPRDAGTKVEVVVQGHVFDRRETGMHIADVINETFGSNGLTFATGRT